MTRGGRDGAAAWAGRLPDRAAPGQQREVSLREPSRTTTANRSMTPTWWRRWGGVPPRHWHVAIRSRRCRSAPSACGAASRGGTPSGCSGSVQHAGVRRSQNAGDVGCTPDQDTIKAAARLNRIYAPLFRSCDVRPRPYRCRRSGLPDSLPFGWTGGPSLWEVSTTIRGCTGADCPASQHMRQRDRSVRRDTITAGVRAVPTKTDITPVVISSVE